MLLGIKPDEMMEEEHLVAWNPDRDEDKGNMWAYPPVMLLEAAHDYYWYAERMNRTVDFFRRQESLSHSPQHVLLFIPAMNEGWCLLC